MFAQSAEKHTETSVHIDFEEAAKAVESKLHRYMLVALAGKLAVCDGDLNSQEVIGFFKAFNTPESERAELVTLMRDVEYDAMPTDYYADKVRQILEEDEDQLRDILHKLFDIALADKALNLKELHWLKEMTAQLGLMESDFLQLVRDVMMPHHSSPYKMLGVHKLATKKELNAAFRKALSDYHPDRFSGHEWAQDIAVIAGVRNSHLSQAYQAIRG